MLSDTPENDTDLCINERENKAHIENPEFEKSRPSYFHIQLKQQSIQSISVAMRSEAV